MGLVSSQESAFAAASDSPRGDNAWRIVMPASPAQEYTHKTLFALADGTIGVRASLEERPSEGDGVVHGRVFDRLPLDYHERFPGLPRSTDTRVPVADATRILVRLGDERLEDGQARTTRELDLRSGLTGRITHWTTASGRSLSVTSERTADFGRPGVFAIRFTLASTDYDGPVVLHSLIDADQRAAQKSDDPRFGSEAMALATTAAWSQDDVAVLVQSAPRSGAAVACAQAHRLHGLAAAGLGADVAGHEITARLVPGQSLTVEKFFAYADGADQAAARAAEAVAAVAAEGFDAVAARQAKAWAAFWDAADLGVEGAPRLDVALRFNLFHLNQSAPREGGHGLAAKGMTGEGYEGHVFWDTETFVLPALAATDPDLARNLVAYRFKHLDQARAHAREMGHKRGALFPWRTIAGGECSSFFPGGTAQYHINTAVAFAIELYDRISGDEAFLFAEGAEILAETARLWIEVGNYDARRGGQFCICGVTGPDEYTALVDNDFYTNLTAKRHLAFAAATLERMQAQAPSAYAALAAKLDVQAHEAAEWRRASDAMRLGFDAELGVHAQDDTFLSKPLWDFAGTKDQHPLLLHFHPMTLYRHQVCKQADVVLALILAGEGIDREQKRRDFDYYEPITVHDSTLSASSYAILAAEVGHGAQALKFLDATARVDLDDLHGNASHGAHMAAMGGSWMSLVWGLGGFRPGAQGPGFDPIIPQGLDGWRFRLAWRGRKIAVSAKGGQARYELLSGEALDIVHAGEIHGLKPGQPLALACRAVSA